MSMTHTFAATEPTRSEIDSLRGATVLEFGTPWCGFCQRAQPLIETAFAEHPEINHIKVEDGSGRPLGRSFRVKLWPTLIFLRDGQEVARVVRPNDSREIVDAMQGIAA
ncbi:thioredoxin family protein [Cupriavidus pauculus]|uniref:thioredoxin family protein n=1 Tax=Cupriavidus pauculus TaxID=82633 RepID=UPI001D0C5D32|nr:thioredoxin family protein [Cupriavidus pauculus]MCM3605984.1 thioredoxin family protein [Cupriavidus pauculus]